MNLGVVIVLIAAVGFVSNTLNWRYLNYGVIRFLYYIGAFVHETSHAVLCVLTGAKIVEFKVFSSQPRVVHRKSKLPILGGMLMSFAPMAGGLLFLFLVNRYLLGSYFSIPRFSNWHDLRDTAVLSLRFLAQIDLRQWQSWAMILLLFNVGAMIGPSPQDLKNIWPVLIVLFFIRSPFFADLGSLALSLVLVNLIIQVLLIVAMKTISIIRGQ